LKENMGERNHYQTLFVAETATAEEIRKAYFILAKKFHDDLNRSASPEERAFCEAALKEVNSAYEVLSRPDKRAAYDRSRRPAPTGPAPSSYSNPPAGDRRGQPHPVATPDRLEFGALHPGETRGMSFFLANEGDPARSCRLSVGTSRWIQVPGEVDKLPTRIPVEVHVPDASPASGLFGYIAVHMDGIRLDIAVSGRVEIPVQAAQQPQRGEVFSIFRAKGKPKRVQQNVNVKCPFCGFENPPGVSACQHCELPLARNGLLCPYCGERLPSSACNCPGCGKLVTLW
jgi:hypothetical protein